MDTFNIVQKQTKETLDRIMTLRCLGIGWSLAKMTFTYRRAKLYNTIALKMRESKR